MASSHVDSPIRAIMIRLIASEEIRHGTRRTIGTPVFLPIARIPVSIGRTGCDNVFFIGWVDEA